VDVDATNLAYTVAIPNGKNVIILATGTYSYIGAGTGAGIAIADGTTTLVETTISYPATTADAPFALSVVVTGTGASKTFKLRFRSDGSTSFTIRNNNATIAPRLTFIGA
jgi:hypothetical protein